MEILFKIFEAHPIAAQFGISKTILHVIQRHFLAEVTKKLLNVFWRKVALPKSNKCLLPAVQMVKYVEETFFHVGLGYALVVESNYHFFSDGFIRLLGQLLSRTHLLEDLAHGIGVNYFILVQKRHKFVDFVVYHTQQL